MKIACTLLFASLVALPVSAVVYAQSPAPCDAGSTLKDTFNPADTQRAEQFLATLKTAVKANDKAEVAAMVEYPVRVNLPGGMHRLIRTPQQFRAQFDFLFNDRTRAAIDRQVPACMFANSQGAMIGDGEVWFQDFNGKFRIWSFNRM